MARCSIVCENGKLSMFPDDDVIVISESEDEEFISYIDDASDEDCGEKSSEAVNENVDASSKTVFSLECLHKPSDPGLDIVPIDLSSDESSSGLITSVKTEPENDPEVSEVPDLFNKSVLVAAQNGFEVVAPNLASEENDIKFITSNHHERICPGMHFEGEHNFRIGLTPYKALKNLKESVYCCKQNKLFVSINQIFEVFVKVDDVPPGTFIRVYAAFSEPKHWSKSVRRCPAHEQMDLKNGSILYEHFVLSLTEHAIYKKDGDLLSVSVPYVKPHSGAEYTCYLFKFTCFSSCFGGIDRRPISVVFSLEKDDIVLGRQSVHVKVCANPVRDYQTELKKFCSGNSASESAVEDLNGFKENIDEAYSIKVHNFELYNFLEHMKTLYESGALVQQMNQRSKNG